MDSIELENNTALLLRLKQSTILCNIVAPFKASPMAYQKCVGVSCLYDMLSQYPTKLSHYVEMDVECMWMDGGKRIAKIM